MCISVIEILKDDALEETGWKLVHGDVFRPPQHPMLLVACIGSGLQLLCMVLVIIGMFITYYVSLVLAILVCKINILLS